MVELNKQELMAKAKEMGVTFSYADTAEKINEKIQLHLAKEAEKVRTADEVEQEVKAVKAVQDDGLVNVACKIPNGIRFNTPYGEYMLKGVRMSEIVKAGGYLPAGSYNITPIPAKAWEWIKEHYKDQPFLINKIIFAEREYNSAVAKAKDLDKDVESGFEQIDPKKTRTKKVVTE